MSARGAAILAAIMVGVSPEQAVSSLGDDTRCATPSAAELARGSRLLARYRQASKTALDWLAWQDKLS
jgi:hypothetical protein